MGNCLNHPDKEALSICHGCGKEFCELCLDEGTEYYYCKNQECQELLKKELPLDVLNIVICPECNSELELSEEENSKGKIRCPECDRVIDFTTNPPKTLDVENYIEVISTFNQADIAVIKSILEDGEIDYFILGETFLSVRPLLEAARIFINTSQIEDANSLLKDFDFNIFGISTNK